MVRFRDTRTSAVMFTSPLLELPLAGGPMQLTLTMNGQKHDAMYYIDATDPSTSTAYVTLQKEYINDVLVPVPDEEGLTR